jgi:hypothetical protein
VRDAESRALMNQFWSVRWTDKCDYPVTSLLVTY